MKKTPIELIIFDCDGTLIDSEPLCNIALSELLLEYDVNVSSQTLMAEFKGGKLAAIFAALENRYSFKFQHDAVENYRKRVEQLFAARLRPTPFTRSVLPQITQPFCIASNAPPEKILQALTCCDLAHFFTDNIFSSYQINRWKPEPHVFFHAAESMGYSPCNCLVIEDSESGIQAAQNAGMRSVFYNPHQLTINADFDIQIESMAMLLDTINHMSSL